MILRTLSAEVVLDIEVLRSRSGIVMPREFYSWSRKGNTSTNKVRPLPVEMPAEQNLQFQVDSGDLLTPHFQLKFEG